MRRMMLIVTFVLLLGMAAASLAAPPQQGNLADDVFTITCDTGEELIGGTKFTFLNINPGFSYRVSAIGIGEFDPVMAVITEPGVGGCNDDNPRVAGSQVAIPGIGLIEADQTDAQVTVSKQGGGDVDVVVGGFQGSSGQFAMVIEGLAINPRDELDAFLISVPEVVADEPIGVYMVSRSGSALDPYMELYGGVGLQTWPADFDNVQLIGSCDDAGVGTCANTPAFPGGGVAIANGSRYEAGAQDAGLVFSLGSTDRYLYAFGSSGSASSGDYAIIVIGVAPGNIQPEPTTPVIPTPGPTPVVGPTPPVGCNNVAVSITAVSSQYDNTYAPENLLDGNPNTSWSTNGISADGEYFIVGLGRVYTVSEVRFNSYSATAGFETDSVKDFIIVRLTSDDKLQAVTEGTAALQPGYQTYTFAPVQVSELGFILISNYGGSNFEASDVMVCGQ